MLWYLGRVEWWYENRKLREVKLSQLITLVKEPALRDKEILYFYGAHEGKERYRPTVSRFIFYSKHNMEFGHMRKLFSVNAVSADKRQLGGLEAAKAVIEKKLPSRILVQWKGEFGMS